MTFLWLPKWAPELNPMDTLWGRDQDVIASDKKYAMVDEQVGRFGHLNSPSGLGTLHTSGVLFDGFG
jgi:hypothetical protein